MREDISVPSSSRLEHLVTRREEGGRQVPGAVAEEAPAPVEDFPPHQATLQSAGVVEGQLLSSSHLGEGLVWLENSP